MAGMDYEQLSFNDKGKVTEQYENLPFPNEVSIEPYKNFLYLVSEKLWQEGNGYSNPTLAQVREGVLSLYGIDIQVKRYGRGNRMVWYASHYYRDKEKPLATDEAKSISYCGICTYGHMNTDKYYVERAGFKYSENKWHCGSTNYNARTKRMVKNKSGWITYIEPSSSLNHEGMIIVKNNTLIESWVGITKYDIQVLHRFLHNDCCNTDMSKAIESNYPIDTLPEIEVNSFLTDGTPSLFNMFFGKKGRGKDIDIKRYL